jgi:hypothetical protein
MKHLLFIVLGLVAISGCRNAEDRVYRDNIRPAVAGYSPGEITVANAPVPKYRLRGNTLYVSRGERPVYVLPMDAVKAGPDSQTLSEQDERLDAYLGAMEVQLDHIRRQQMAKPEAPPIRHADPQRALIQPAGQISTVSDNGESIPPAAQEP